LQEVGEIMHLAGSGRVIIQLSQELVEGQILCDDKGTRVAKVMELIGPIKRPFASATPLTNNINKLLENVFSCLSNLLQLTKKI
jgi:Gar1/Naf1 RNA binding region.